MRSRLYWAAAFVQHARWQSHTGSNALANMPKPQYVDVKHALYREAAPLDAAECHGVLCGMLCALGSVSVGSWLDEYPYYLGEGPGGV